MVGKAAGSLLAQESAKRKARHPPPTPRTSIARSRHFMLSGASTSNAASAALVSAPLVVFTARIEVLMTTSASENSKYEL